MKRLLHKYFWTDLYYNIKWGFINFFKYFKIVSKQRPWDYMYMIQMLEFQLIDLEKHMTKYSPEVEEGKDKTITEINKALKLIKNLRDDNYAERCGYNSNYNTWFDELESTKNKPKEQKLYEMKSDSKQTEEELHKIFTDATELEKKEFDELFDILKNNMKGWWY
jgi:hypothetical protein